MIVAGLHEMEEDKLLQVFGDKRETFGWNIHDMKGLDPTLCIHKINTKDGSLPKHEITIITLEWGLNSVLIKDNNFCNINFVKVDNDIYTRVIY